VIPSYLSCFENILSNVIPDNVTRAIIEILGSLIAYDCLYGLSPKEINLDEFKYQIQKSVFADLKYGIYSILKKLFNINLKAKKNGFCQTIIWKFGVFIVHERTSPTFCFH
jgi:hypothetical protein